MKVAAGFMKLVFLLKVRKIKPLPENAAAVVFVISPDVYRWPVKSHKQSSTVKVVSVPACAVPE